MRGLIISLVLGFVGQAVLAETVQLTGYKSFGRKCTGDAVQVLTNGNTFSILFNEFGINMSEGDRTEGKARAEVCHVIVDFNVPNNQCLDRLDQVLSGGIIKSRNSSGVLNVAYSVPAIADVKHIIWKYGNEIRPEDEDSLFTLDLSKAANRHVCIRGNIRYNLVMVYSAVRKTFSPDFFISNVDSEDSEITLRLRTR